MFDRLTTEAICYLLSAEIFSPRTVLLLDCGQSQIRKISTHHLMHSISKLPQTLSNNADVWHTTKGEIAPVRISSDNLLGS